MKNSSDKHRLAKLISCARRMMGLSQEKMAEAIGIHQSTYSRFENGSLEPSVFQWKAIAERLDLPFDAIKYQYLDRQTLTEIRSYPLEGGFTIPKIYADRRALKVRELLPLIFYVQQSKGEAAFTAAVTNLGMDPNFFVCLDNQVNLKFLEDLLTITGVEDSESVIQEICRYNSFPEFHGALSSYYYQAESQLDLIRRYVHQSKRYQGVFEYDLHEKPEKPDGVVLSVKPTQLFQDLALEFEASTLGYLELSREYTLQSLSLFPFQGQAKVQKEVFVKETHSIYQGHNETRYLIWTAA